MGRLRHSFAINSTRDTIPYSQEETPNSQLLPEEQRLWDVPLVLQLLRLPPEEWVLKTPSSKSQWGLYPQDSQDYSK